MNLAEKLKFCRTEMKASQIEMAEKLGISRRTYINYEQGTSLPRDAKVIERMAKLLGISIDYLMDERDEFLLKTEDAYGYRGKMQAKKIIEATEQLCAGGSLSPEDEEQFQQHLFQIFTRMKERNRTRYAQSHENAESKPK